MVAVLLILTLALGTALALRVRETRKIRRSLTRLEQRIATLEVDSATTVVIEPESDPPPPRRPSQLLN